MNGPDVISESLKSSGLKYFFGIVGVPITPVAAALQQGKTPAPFYGFRNEQSASYATSIFGYLTGFPACCLTVAGPGLIHALPGMANATSNCWPMIVVSAGPPTDSQTTGFFQETPQIEAAKLYSKFSVRVETIKKVKYFIHKAVRTAIQGRPGAVYVEIASNVITDQILDEKEVKEQFSSNIVSYTFDKPISSLKTLESVRDLLVSAKKPLLVIGKGAAYSRAEEAVLNFVSKTQIPFLPTPMGKGVISDRHPLCAGAARTQALKEADVVILVGARLNWMLHYGQAPRYNENVKFIQFEIHPEEFHSSQQIYVPVAGDLNSNLQQLQKLLEDFQATGSHQVWRDSLEQTKEKNSKTLTQKVQEDKIIPMGYHYVLYQLAQLIPDSAIIVNEGANTMDFGRMILPNIFPRTRLDAGTTGTMGIGVGYAIAAALAHPDKLVVCVQGDSAFGFSGMELETAVRFGLRIIFIIINNNGIYRGTDELSTDPTEIPVTSLLPNAHYEKIMEAFGGDGYFVRTPEEYEKVLRTVFDQMTLESERTKSSQNNVDPQNQNQNNNNSNNNNNNNIEGLKSSIEQLELREGRKMRPQLINVMIKPEGPLPKILSH